MHYSTSKEGINEAMERTRIFGDISLVMRKTSISLLKFESAIRMKIYYIQIAG